MARMEYCLGVIVISICLISSVQSSFICYNCLYPDKNCADNFQPLVPTSYCTGSCLKIRGERWSDSVRTVEVYRLCGEQKKEGCTSDVMYNGISTTQCACNANYCNHSNSLVVSGLAVTVAGVMAIFVSL
ncbi:uncharacterized protein [Haliotis cracherodii]|uniref:uncharacterized protein n=1 Tax=Haliotis cracherodii TaxID=6455 RepID=UPI0039EAA114